jgi:hypothetical protein
MNIGSVQILAQSPFMYATYCNISLAFRVEVAVPNRTLDEWSASVYNCSAWTLKSPPSDPTIGALTNWKPSRLVKWFIAGVVVVFGVLVLVLQAWDILHWIGVLQ